VLLSVSKFIFSVLFPVFLKHDGGPTSLTEVSTDPTDTTDRN